MTSPMLLPDYYYEPFDLTYSSVTERIYAHIADQGYSGAARSWIETIVTEFQNERKHWNTATHLDDYRREWSRLKRKPLKLAAAAFLHISYDLPRVLASDWPGAGKWVPMPTESNARHIYDSLRDIFPEVYGRVSTCVAVVGVLPAIAGQFLRIFPRKHRQDVYVAISMWMLFLREAAWAHGESLTRMGVTQRKVCEGRIRRAMASSLKKVSDSSPLSIVRLMPPTGVFALVVVPHWMDALVEYLGPFWLGFTSATVLALIAIFFVVRFLRLRSEEISFIHRLGGEIHERVNLAVRDGERFDSVFGATDE